MSMTTCGIALPPVFGKAPSTRTFVLGIVVGNGGDHAGRQKDGGENTLGEHDEGLEGRIAPVID